MNKNIKFSLVSLLFLLAGCKTNVSSSISESNNNVSSNVSSSEVSSSSSSSSITSTSSSEVNPYGELIIPTMKIFTNFPDTPLPTFTNEEYKSEITYNVIDTDIVEYKDGYIVGKKAGAAISFDVNLRTLPGRFSSATLFSFKPNAILSYTSK